MKFVFIVNPIAGNEDKTRMFKNIKAAFRHNDHEMIIEETQGQGDAKNIAARYAKEFGAECVVVACGAHCDGVCLGVTAYARLSHTGGIARGGPILCIELVGCSILLVVVFEQT